MTLRRRPSPPGAYIPPRPVASAGVSPSPSSLVKVSEPAALTLTEGSVEIFKTTLFLPSSAEASVCTLAERWRSVDVYVDTTQATMNLGGGAFLSVGIYAVTRGVRVLVKTGRVRENIAARVCSVRLPIADRFEVTYAYNDLPSTEVEPVTFVVVGTNEVSSEDDGDGVISMSVANHVAGGPALTLLASIIPFQLVGINAVSEVATPRYVHVHDISSINPGVLNGRFPCFCFGLPSAGATVFGESFALLAARRILRGLGTICASTTAEFTTLAAAGDVTMAGFVR